MSEDVIFVLECVKCKKETDPNDAIHYASGSICFKCYFKEDDGIND